MGGLGFILVKRSHFSWSHCFGEAIGSLLASERGRSRLRSKKITLVKTRRMEARRASLAGRDQVDGITMAPPSPGHRERPRWQLPIVINSWASESGLLTSGKPRPVRQFRQAGSALLGCPRLTLKGQPWGPGGPKAGGLQSLRTLLGRSADDDVQAV